MEVDSMHSAIEHVRKKMRISSPYEWPAVIQAARREKPYKVHEVDREEFVELHQLPKLLKAERSLKGIPWMKVKCVRVTKGLKHEIEIKTDYCREYQKVTLQKAETQRTRRAGTTSETSLSKVVVHFEGEKGRLDGALCQWCYNQTIS